MADHDAYPSCSYPTSSLRDEPYLRPPPDAPRGHPTALVAPNPPRPILDPIFNRYQEPFPQEVFPGVREDGVLTARHPLVAAFIAALPHTPPREGLKPPREAWWTKRIRGITVRDVLGLQAELSELQGESVFALAALKLLYQFNHPAHFTLWGRESGPRTARRVQKILYMSPSPIASPVGWAGTQEQLWLVHGLQKSIFSNKADEEDGEAASNGMILRKRKVCTEGRPPSERPKKRTRNAGHDNAASNAIDADANETAHESHVDLEKDSMSECIIDDEVTSTPVPNTRRSTRQSRKHNANNASESVTSTPATVPAPLPEPNDTSAPPPPRRARSASSAGSSTAISDNGSAIDTCVEPDADGEDRDSNARANGDSHKKLLEEELKVRTSTRVRKLAPKKAEALELELEEREQANVKVKEAAAAPKKTRPAQSSAKARASRRS